MTSSLFTSARIRWFTLPALLAALAGPAVSTARADDNVHEQLSVAEKFTGDLPEMRKRKRIRALVTYRKTDFFFHQGATKGIQAEFLREYEIFLNKGVKRAEDKTHITFLPVTFNELLPSLQQGKGDIAAGKMTGRETVQYVANIYKYYGAYKLASQVTNTDAIPVSGAR